MRVRAFEPAELPAVLVEGRRARARRDLDALAAALPGALADAAAGVAGTARPRLFLDPRHPLVEALGRAAEAGRFEAVDEALLLLDDQAALLAGHHRDPADRARLLATLARALLRGLEGEAR